MEVGISARFQFAATGMQADIKVPAQAIAKQEMNAAVFLASVAALLTAWQHTYGANQEVFP